METTACRMKPQLVEWITKKEMATALQMHGAVISLISLEHLPQNFT